MRSVKFIDQLMEQKKLKNDVAVCKELGWSSGQISQYRKGKNIMNNEACLQLALALNIDPLQIIMAADMDRAERTGQRSLWEVFSMRGAANKLATSMMAGFVSVNLFLTPQDLPHYEKTAKPVTNTLYYVKYGECSHDERPSPKSIYIR